MPGFVLSQTGAGFALMYSRSYAAVADAARPLQQMPLHQCALRLMALRTTPLQGPALRQMPVQSLHCCVGLFNDLCILPFRAAVVRP